MTYQTRNYQYGDLGGLDSVFGGGRGQGDGVSGVMIWERGSLHRLSATRAGK